MKLALKILVVGMLVVIVGVGLRLNGVESNIDYWLMGIGLLIELVAIAQLVRLVFSSES